MQRQIYPNLMQKKEKLHYDYDWNIFNPLERYCKCNCPIKIIIAELLQLKRILSIYFTTYLTNLFPVKQSTATFECNIWISK